MLLFDWLLEKGINNRREIAKNHRINEIQGRQEIAAEEWQLQKIKQGTQNIISLNKIDELENKLEIRKERIARVPTWRVAVIA